MRNVSQGCDLTPKQLCHYFQNIFLFYVVQFKCHFLSEIAIMQWIFVQYFGYCWPWALEPGRQYLQCWVYIHAFPDNYGLKNSVISEVVISTVEKTQYSIYLSHTVNYFWYKNLIIFFVTYITHILTGWEFLPLIIHYNYICRSLW